LLAVLGERDIGIDAMRAKFFRQFGGPVAAIALPGAGVDNDDDTVQRVPLSVVR
jgi:hypothetical protein